MKHTPSTVGRPFEPAKRQTTSQGSTMVTPVEHGTVGCFHLWLASLGGAGSIGILEWGNYDRVCGSQVLGCVRTRSYVNIYWKTLLFMTF